MTDLIRSSLDAGVLRLSFTRADKKNSLTNQMYVALSEKLESANTDPKIRVVLITGEGEMFSAGNDMAEFLALADDRLGEPWQVFRFMRALARLTKPLIAAVQGRGVGIGTTMLLHCDQVLLADDALLSVPFVNLALSPEAASSVLLTQRIGHQRAFTMFSTGQAVDARSAVAWGLANEAVPRAELEVRALEIANRLAAKPLGSLVTTKALMKDVDSLVSIIDREEVELMVRLRSAEAREAFLAFSEKRKPNFSQFA